MDKRRQKGGEQMAENKGYAGRIKNSGSQVVKAPYASEAKRGQSTVKKGEDLRGGGKKE